MIYADAVREGDWDIIIKSLYGYVGKILLAGTDFDKSTRKHTSEIEEWGT